MDFVEWCGLVLNKLIEVSYTSPSARSIGVDRYQLEEAILGHGFTAPEQYNGIYDAVRELKKLNLIESKSPGPRWKATRLGRELTRDKDWTPLWQIICREKLEQEEEQLLKIVNKLSPHSANDYAWLEDVNHEAILSELGWAEGIDKLGPVAQELEQAGLIACSPYISRRIEPQATYRGLVWETRRGFTLISRLIDELVAEWETTSVEFKQELHTDTADQKAELIKDVISLVNPQASGRRWLIIGFADDTHDYYGRPDPKLTPEHLQQLMQDYLKPVADIQYEVVDYRKGLVGMLEIHRDQKKLPYRVKKAVGSYKTRLNEDDTFIRHGSLVARPDHDELKAIQDEGDRARATP